MVIFIKDKFLIYLPLEKDNYYLRNFNIMVYFFKEKNMAMVKKLQITKNIIFSIKMVKNQGDSEWEVKFNNLNLRCKLIIKIYRIYLFKKSKILIFNRTNNISKIEKK